jgi:TolB-like protein/DNA-binding winged helix-turn-helix (wHTH) protein/Flp pilus assembly protein TadD
MPGQRFRFGPYESRPESRELYKHGFKLKVRPQPLQVLNALLSRAGEVVTRDDLRRRLWSSETFVDFEHSLYTSVKEIRGVLGDSADEPRYIQTLPKLGYRFIAPVEVIESAVAAGVILGAPDSTAEDSDAPAAASVGSKSWRWTLAGAIVAVFLVALGAGVYYFHIHQATRPQPALNRSVLAVLPFENLTGDPAQEYLSDGLTEEMIAQLGRLDPAHLGVIARSSVMHYKGSRESLEKVGNTLKVQYVLEGSVRREANRIRISAKLEDVKGQALWSREYDRESGHLLSLEGELAQEISGEISSVLGSPKRVMQVKTIAPSPERDESQDLYLKGMYFWNKRSIPGFQRSSEYFQRAIEKDPNNAAAYAALANCYALVGGYVGTPQTESMPKARAAALRALAIDENLPEAHTAVALIEQNYDWDWVTAGKEYRRAIELNPNYATAHHWYAEHLADRGRFDEALAESERARELDPLSLIIAADNGVILYYARRYDDSIKQFQAVEEMEPHFIRTGMIIYAQVKKQQFTDALNIIQKRREIYGDGAWTWGQLAYVYGSAGQQSEARHAVQKLEELSRHEKIDPAVFALASLGIQDRERAFFFLDQAYAQHSGSLTSLKVEPIYDSLRSDPRFQLLLHRVRLDQ